MSSEQRGFVFSIVFIITFSTLLMTIPVGLMGEGATPSSVVTPIDPNLLTDFTASESYNRSDFIGGSSYGYDLGGRAWIIMLPTGVAFTLGAKILYLGGIWLGQMDSVRFVAPNNINRGTALTFSEIAEDATDGVVRYSLYYDVGGTTAGGFICYWNTTTYSTPLEAWNANKLLLLHGVGVADTATTDIMALLISLLVLQLPDVPVLVNLFLAVPVWAGIIFIIWFIIKETLPFV